MKYITGLLQRIIALAYVLKLRAQKQESARITPRPPYLPQPIFVRVPNGFNIPFKTNGASRRRKSNRLHTSTKTRNKHR